MGMWWRRSWLETDSRRVGIADSFFTIEQSGPQCGPYVSRFRTSNAPFSGPACGAWTAGIVPNEGGQRLASDPPNEKFPGSLRTVACVVPTTRCGDETARNADPTNCYNIVKDPVKIYDFNATILHCLGIDHQWLTFRFQGRDFRLTDVHGNVVAPILA
jgi:hypothetical protein